MCSQHISSECEKCGVEDSMVLDSVLREQYQGTVPTHKSHAASAAQAICLLASCQEALI